MKILYGSETGTAEGLAEIIWQDARLRRLKSLKLMAIDDYKIQVFFLPFSF